MIDYTWGVGMDGEVQGDLRRCTEGLNKARGQENPPLKKVTFAFSLERQPAGYSLFTPPPLPCNSSFSALLDPAQILTGETLRSFK